MASPTLKVEIAFVSEPLDTTPTWTDVSQYVRATSAGGGGVSIRRGKGPGIGPFEAGSCTVTLSNRDRRFDPSHAAGPNFGNLIPRKQIRITATWSAVDYVMFTGWVTGWPQAFSNYGEDAIVTIQAIDALAWLAQTDLPDDLVYSYASTTIGSLAFFLRQADTSSWWDATGSGYSAVFVNGVGRTAASLAPGMASTAISLDGSTYWALAEWVPAGNWSISFWVQTSDIDGATYVLGANNTGAVTGVYITAAGSVGVANVGVTNTFVVPPVNNNIPHHVVITAHSSSGVTVYVDAVASSTAPVSFFATKLNVIGNSSAGGLSFLTGNVQDLAVFNKALTGNEIVALYARQSGFLVETTTQRVTRLLDDVGWPATSRSLTSTPEAEVGELIYDGASVLGKLQEVERSEQGWLFASKANDMTFLSRYYDQEVTAGNTVQQIFSDDGGATALPYSTFQFQYNDIDVTNAASVTTPTTRAASSDATSITVNGLQSKKVDTILSTFAQANSMAAGLVAEGKDAKYRAAPIMVYPSLNTTRWDEVLLLELGYRVSMEITPMGVGSQNAQEVTLEQIEWSIVDTLWTLTVAGSPCFGAGAAAGWFIVGSSLVGGSDLVGY